MHRLKRLNSLLQGFLEEGPVGCSCAVTRRGELLYQECFGYADLEAQRPITPDTIYRVYSMSKIVTCVAALMLYERGVYLLNDPLEAYLPEFKDSQVVHQTNGGKPEIRPAASPIRVKDLFTMSSGLTYGGEQTETDRLITSAVQELDKKEAAGEKYDVRMFSKALASVPLAFDPGTHWMYSLSHEVLGALIEVLSGKKFGQFLKEEIFDPLDMNDTGFRIDEKKRSRLCTFYHRAEDGSITTKPEIDRHFQPDAIFESGGAGLLSTIGDYGRFARMLTGGGELDGARILGSKTIGLMTANHMGTKKIMGFDWLMKEGYGYGLGVRTLINLQEGGCNGSIGEFGWAGWAGTWVMMDPKEDLSAVYMQQMIPHRQEYSHPRIRSVIYGML